MKEKDIKAKYFSRAKFVANLLALAPFVRMVGLNGSLARGEATEQSDIDFLIITREGRIWTCRAFVTLLTHLTGLRRYGKKIAGRICLNRYQTDDFVDIEPRNDYHAKVFSVLEPLLDINQTYCRYVGANLWMKDFGWPVKISPASEPNKILSFFRERLEEFLGKGLGDWLENKLKKFQTDRIKRDVRTLTSPEGRVRISDKELCFHPVKFFPVKGTSSSNDRSVINGASPVNRIDKSD